MKSFKAYRTWKKGVFQAICPLDDPATLELIPNVHQLMAQALKRRVDPP